MPITFRTFEGLARVTRNIPGVASSHSGRAEDEVTLGAFDSSRTAIDMIGTGSNSSTWIKSLLKTIVDKFLMKI